jgi:CysZ protein
MIQQPFVGAAYLLRGLELVARPGLRRFVALPLAINVAVFALLLWVAVGEFNALVDYLTPQLPQWLAWLAWLLWALFAATAAVLVFFTFSVVANLIAAPFNGLLAEAVERHLTGRAPPGGDGLKAALKEAPAALLDELRKLGYFAKWAVPLLILFVIPGLNLVAPILWGLFSAWMLAVEYGDYPMGNHGLKGAEQRQRLNGSGLMALGFGGMTLLATMIPVVNFLVMPAAVAGATAMWVERLKD